MRYVTNLLIPTHVPFACFPPLHLSLYFFFSLGFLSPCCSVVDPPVVTTHAPVCQLITQLCLLPNTKFAVFFISLSSYRYLGDNGTDWLKFCMMVHISPKQVFSPFGGSATRAICGTPQIQNFGPLTVNISKMVSCSIHVN